MQQRNAHLVFAALFLLLTLFSFSQTKEAPPLSKTSSFGDSTLLNVNRFSYWISNDGISGRNPFTGQEGVSYPRGTGHVIFADGFLWGGYVRDNDPTLPRLRVGGFTYVTGLQPGRIISPGNPQNPNDPEVRIYRIRKDYQTVNEAVLRRDIAELRYNGDSLQVTAADVQDLRDSYARDWQEWPVQAGAPFYDLNGNGQYEPEQGETPGLANADQVIWFVANDLIPNSPPNFAYSPPIGLELQVTLWGYQDDPLLENAVFLRYRVINKSGARIDSMFFGKWVDCDIGSYIDDFVGCDPGLDLAYAYNGYPQDADYQPFGLNPPAMGFAIVQGPRVPAPGDSALFDLNWVHGYRNLPASSIWPKSVGTVVGEPGAWEEDAYLGWYNVLNGYQPYSDSLQQVPFRYGSGPHRGEITKFPMDGDPIRGTGDIDGQGANLQPGARRFLLASGPFEMQPGDTQEVVYALVGGDGGDHITNINPLKFHAKAARFYYRNRYRQPAAVPSPTLLATSRNGQVVLDWSSDLERINQIEQDDSSSGFRFEGYILYQLPRADASLDEGIRLKTFDKESPPSVILGWQRDPQTGMYLEQPLISGSNNGIEHFYVLDEDAFSSAPFIDGQEYHFAVTAYRYHPDPEYPRAVMLSEPAVIRVVAHRDNPGYSADFGESLPVQYQGFSSARVEVQVINPALLTGHDYRVGFDGELQYYFIVTLDSNGQIINRDTVGTWHAWNLYDETSQTLLLENQLNVSGEGYFPVVDGLQVRVDAPKLQDIFCEFTGQPWISGVNWGGGYYPDCLGLVTPSASFFGSTLTDSQVVPLQIDFQDQQDVDQNGFISRGAVYRRDLGYTYAGAGELPIIAHDVLDPDHPRRVNISFVEDENESQANGIQANLTWDMAWNGSQFPSNGLGGREYLFFHLSDYDAGARYDDVNWAPGADVLYALWPKERGSRSYLETSFRWDIHVDIPPTPADTFRFTAPAAPRVPSRFRLYQNYPNPFNSSTTFRYWLPAPSRVSLKIYNILGQEVAVLVNRNQPAGEYFLRWDARNLASGLYIYRLSTPSGSADGKMLLVK